MNNSTPTIFLSYSWANKDIADAIDNDFTSIGLYVQKDRRDVSYRGDLQEYMQRIAKADFVLMILSDEYLRSTNCMYEVTELLNTHEIEKKLLPVLHDNVPKNFDSNGKQLYYDYWKQRIAEEEEHLKQHINEDTLEELQKCKSIYDHLGDFFKRIKYLKAETFTVLKRENYKSVFNIIGWSENKIIEEAIAIQNIIDDEDKDLKLEEFTHKYPSNKYSLFMKAYLEALRKQFKKAKKHYKELIQSFPDFSHAYNNLAVILQHEYLEYEEAILLYKQAIALNPEYFNAHSNLAILFHGIDSKAYEAKQHYTIALQLNPQASDLHYNLAILLTNKFSKYDEAKAHYLIAIEINPFFAKAFYNLSSLLDEFFEAKLEAKEYYTVAIALDSTLLNKEMDDYYDNHK